MVIPEKAAPATGTTVKTADRAVELSAGDAIGRQMRDLINSGLT